MTLGVKVWSGKRTADGSADTLESFTVPEGQIWIVGKVFCRRLISGGENNRLTIVFQHNDPNGVKIKQNTILNCDHDVQNGDKNQWTYNEYIYPGETVEVYEGQDGGRDSKGTYRVPMRRLI